MREWNLPALSDRTVLRPDAGQEDVLRLCQEAKSHCFTVLFVPPTATWTKPWRPWQERQFAKVKASGGIRDWKTTQAMLDAGADRIRTSASLKIVAGWRESSKRKG